MTRVKKTETTDPQPHVVDGEGRPLKVGDTVIFYYAYAQVRRGTVKRVRQTVWDHKKGNGFGRVVVAWERPQEAGRVTRYASDVLLASAAEVEV